MKKYQRLILFFGLIFILCSIGFTPQIRASVRGQLIKMGLVPDYSGGLNMSGDLTVAGDIEVTGTSVTTGAQTFAGAVTCQTTLGVTGATTLSGTVATVGAVTNASTVTTTGTVVNLGGTTHTEAVTNSSSVVNATTMATTGTVTNIGATIHTGAITNTGASTMNGIVTFNGNVMEKSTTASITSPTVQLNAASFGPSIELIADDSVTGINITGGTLNQVLEIHSGAGAHTLQFDDATSMILGGNVVLTEGQTDSLTLKCLTAPDIWYATAAHDN